MPVRTIQVQKIRSIGLTVIDAEESKDFYTKALLFKPISDITVEGQYSDLEGVTDTKIRIVTLQLGDETIELMQYLDIKGKPIPKDSQSNDLWFQHMAIVVSDMDAAYTHLQSYPIDRISDKPQTIPQSNQTAGGVRAFKFKDPNGHDLELIWFPPDKGQDKWHSDTEGLFLGIDHSAVTIANTEQSLQFYQDILGMQVESSSLNQGETQARLDGLPEAEVKVTGLRPAQGGLGIELLDYIKPGNGRPIPNDQKSYDIPHMQVEFVVNDIEKAVDILKQNQVEFVSSQLVKHQGCLIKDPNGHAILLIMQ
ncbi:MAG: VOC family protein [Rivularia sp. (in: Bacteria)]|nr:VOC family protein [Rivularia sp. MS3]